MLLKCTLEVSVYFRFKLQHIIIIIFKETGHSASLLHHFTFEQQSESDRSKLSRAIMSALLAQFVRYTDAN